MTKAVQLQILNTMQAFFLHLNLLHSRLELHIDFLCTISDDEVLGFYSEVVVIGQNLLSDALANVEDGGMFF